MKGGRIKLCGLPLEDARSAIPSFLEHVSLVNLAMSRCVFARDFFHGWCPLHVPWRLKKTLNFLYSNVKLTSKKEILAEVVYLLATKVTL